MHKGGGSLTFRRWSVLLAAVFLRLILVLLDLTPFIMECAVWRALVRKEAAPELGRLGGATLDDRAGLLRGLFFSVFLDGFGVSMAFCGDKVGAQMWAYLESFDCCGCAGGTRAARLLFLPAKLRLFYWDLFTFRIISSGRKHSLVHLRCASCAGGQTCSRIESFKAYFI